MIRLQRVKEIQLGALCSTQPLALREVWGRSLVTPLIEVFFAESDHRLLFGARVGKGARCAEFGAGEFVEGLWEHDVVELFLSTDTGRTYQEFNLSPAGAWWTAFFQAPRVEDRSRLKMPRRVETFSRRGMSGWEAALSLPLDELTTPLPGGGWLNDENTRVNLCLILGDSPRRFFSLVELPGETPNFHQPDAFQPIEVICEVCSYKLGRGVVSDRGREAEHEEEGVRAKNSARCGADRPANSKRENT